MATNTRIPGTIIRSGSIPTTALTGGVVSSSVQVTTLLPGGSVSSSAQVTELLPIGVVSSSVQTKALLPDGVVSSSAQYPGWVTASTQVVESLPGGTVSSSAQYPGWVTGSSQIDITQTTNYTTFSSSVATADTTQTDRLNSLENVTGSYATTGSNIFVGTQSFNDTTNTTSYLDGAIHVAGGMSVRQDLRVSGSVTINGLLTAVSMSTQYVTSSQYNVGVSKITLNDDDVVRFAGISIYDSGSASPTSASIFWDSLQHRFIYENLSGSAYNSSIIIAGPKHTGSLGDEPTLTSGYIPVATGTDHIDNSIMFQTSSRIGIGTTTPSSLLTVAGVTDLASSAATSKLQILRSGTQARIQNYENGSVADLLLNWEGGNIGIGTTTPRAIFQVRTQTDGNLGINNSLIGGGVRLQAYNDAGNSSSRLELDGSLIGFNIAASTVMVISGSSGNVGIGLTNPSNAKLEVVATSGEVFRADAASGAYRIVANQTGVMMNGNIGVGTFTPATKLQVDKSSQVITATTPSGAVFISNLTTGNAGLELGIDDNAVGYIQNRNVTNATYYNLALQPVTGYVGIGTTNPFYKLVVSNGGANGVEIDPENASGTQTAILSYNRSTAAYTPLIIQGLGVTLGHPSYPFTITTSGSVGIGTTNPITLLHVKGTDSLTANTRYIKGWIGGATTWGANSYEELGVGYSGIRSIYVSGDNWDLAFSTGTSATFNDGTQAERMRIKANGNVGIGTTNPTVKLDIRGQTQILTNSEYQLDVQSVNSSAGASIRRYSTSAYAYDVYQASSHHWRAGILGSTAYTIYDYTNLTDRLTILTTGNVGIGTTNPSAKLQVANLTSDNSAYQHITYITANNSDESSDEAYDTTKPSFGVGFRRLWSSSTYTNIASIHAFGSGGWRGGLLFRTKNNTSSSGEPDINAMVMSPAGNVGIGTTNPGEKLHVQGNITVNANSYIKLTTDSRSYMRAAGTNNYDLYIQAHQNIRFGVNHLNVGENTSVLINPSGHVLPGANGTQDLGSASLRWSTVYTSDLSLSNGIGDWTIVEGEDDLFIYNNKNNKVYKFTLQEVDPSTATPKKS